MSQNAQEPKNPHLENLQESPRISKNLQEPLRIDKISEQNVKLQVLGSRQRVKRLTHNRVEYPTQKILKVSARENKSLMKLPDEAWI